MCLHEEILYAHKMYSSKKSVPEPWPPRFDKMSDVFWVDAPLMTTSVNTGYEKFLYWNIAFLSMNINFRAIIH